MRRRFTLTQMIGAAGLAVVLLLTAATLIWREDILRTGLDPKVPFQTYDPPPAPVYTSQAAWALLPREPERWTSAEAPADVFFVHPTTYDGGRHWNAPLGERAAERQLREVMLPNYAGPFVRVGRLFAPRYRQASLYTQLTLRDDAREARRFAYEDIRAAFQVFRERYNQGRPLIIAGVGQGGQLAARLVQEEVAPDPELRARLAGVYLVDVVVPAERYGPSAPLPACERRAQARCVVGWAQVIEGDEDRARRRLQRALVWDERGRLVELGDRDALCVNPLLGARSETPAEARLNLGAANATGLEWGARPAFLSRQVSAVCRDGLLRYEPPRSDSLKPSGSWADRRKSPPYNLFYADIEADAQARVAALLAQPDLRRPAPPITESVEVRVAPLRRPR